MRGSVRLASAGALAVTAALVPAGVALADDSPPANLGNGLSRLVQPPEAVRQFRFDQTSLAIRDNAGPGPRRRLRDAEARCSRPCDSAARPAA